MKYQINYTTMPDKTKQKGAIKGDIKEQILNLLLNDTDLLTKIVEAVTTCIMDKIIHSKDILKNLSTAIISTDEFKDTIISGRQEIYDSVTFDLGDSEDRVKSLEERNNDLELSVTNLIDEIDNLQQYSRRNCILIHGIKELEELKDTDELSVKDADAVALREDTDELVLKVFREKLLLHGIEATDLDRTHRVGKKSKVNKKPRPIIVKFARYNIRNEVFRSKRKLKATGITITESLTSRRLQLLKEVQGLEQVKSAWTSDGRVVCLLQDNKTKMQIEKQGDLERLQKSTVKPRRSLRTR